MTWRGVYICGPAVLILRHKQLIVNQNGDEIFLPIEGIGYLILDTRQTTITGSILSELLQSGVTMLQSDANHTSCGIAFLFQSY